MGVGDGGEPRDIRNEICLKILGLSAPCTGVKSTGVMAAVDTKDRADLIEHSFAMSTRSYSRRSTRRN